jgi:hypothetical protein
MKIPEAGTLALGSTTSISTWIQNNVVPLVLLFVAIVIMASSKKKKHQDVIVMVGIVLAGLAVLRHRPHRGQAPVGVPVRVAVVRLANDDDTATVDNVYLGPRGWSFWWTARYSAYGVGFCLFFLAMGLEQKAGLGLGIWPVVFTLLATIGATRKIGTVVTYETPLRALLVIFWHEVTAPRSPTGHTAELHPGKVRTSEK